MGRYAEPQPDGISECSMDGHINDHLCATGRSNFDPVTIAQNTQKKKIILTMQRLVLKHQPPTLFGSDACSIVFIKANMSASLASA